MAKKKTNVGTILGAVAVVLGIVAVCMFFLTSVKVVTKILNVTSTTEFHGKDVVFGLEDYAGFSFMNLLPYILVIVGVVFAIAALVAKKNAKMFDYIAGIAMVVAGVLFFITAGFTQWTEGYRNLLDLGIKAETTTVSLGIGAIISAITSILAGVLVCAKQLMKK